MGLRGSVVVGVVGAGLIAWSITIAAGFATAATPTTTVPAASTAAPSTPAGPSTTAAPVLSTTTPIAPTTSAAATTAAPATPTTTAAPTTSTTTTVTSTTVPAGISGDEIRAAKVGWSRFVAANFATPDAILDPCPLLAVDAANAGVAGLGLVPTDLPYGVSLYRDATGVGIIGIVCGADLTEFASPAGATLFAVEVTLLDGQAVFPQYVVRVGGQNTPIERSTTLGGDMIGRCRNDAQFCVASWHSNGLVVTVKLDGPRTPESDAQVRALLDTVAPQVVANLARVAPNA